MRRNLLNNVLRTWSGKNLAEFCKNQLNINNFLPIQVRKILFSKFLLIVQYKYYIRYKRLIVDNFQLTLLYIYYIFPVGKIQNQSILRFLAKKTGLLCSQKFVTKAELLQEGIFFLIQLFARAVLVMTKWEIQKFKPTFIVSVFKVEY